MRMVCIPESEFKRLMKRSFKEGTELGKSKGLWEVLVKRHLPKAWNESRIKKHIERKVL